MQKRRGNAEFPLFFDIKRILYAGKTGGLAEMGYKVFANYLFRQVAVAPVARPGRGLKPAMLRLPFLEVKSLRSQDRGAD